MVQLVPPAGPPSEEAVLAEVAGDAAEALVPGGEFHKTYVAIISFIAMWKCQNVEM